MFNLPSVTITGIEISDMFFNFVNPDYPVKEQAIDLLYAYPSFKHAGITPEMLTEDYYNRV